MSIKDLFKRRKVDKVLANATLDKVGRGIESPDYVKANVKDKKRFIPHIDFSSASNFAIYGSAEKYYSDSINYILNQYPYDGSKKEKIQWSLSGTYLDRHVFENEYPRTNGYATLGKNVTYGAFYRQNYLVVTQPEYIYFKGSPHPYNKTDIPTGSLATLFDKSNIYNTASAGTSNTEIYTDRGVSVEFWFQKDSYIPGSESRRQAIVDIWNNVDNPTVNTVDGLTSSYGRFTVEISGTATQMGDQFHVALYSGSEGFSSSSLFQQGFVEAGSSIAVATVPIGQNLNLTSSKWTHYALTFKNTGSQMMGKLYVNGTLNDTVVTGSSMGNVPSSKAVGSIGSLITSPRNERDFGHPSYGVGIGSLSASLDEFRFWKEQRTAEQIGKYWFTEVNGGSNSDITLAPTASTKYSYENPVNLGLYYKFNEGIINASGTNSIDGIVLDYSGRTTNGDWIAYAYGSRSTGSAIVLAGAADSEFKDPIIRSTNPLVSDYTTIAKEKGKWWDVENNSSLYGSLPKWITHDDQNVASGQLQNLTQIIGSYFDTLQLQITDIPKIKYKENISGSDKPYPFVDRLLDSSGFITSEIFTKATDLEYLASRNDVQNFTLKLNETKNLIYQNIYNILIYLFKTKGTDKAFRNLIRCFGVGEELVKINLYGDNARYELKDNVDYTVIKKRYADFNDPDRFDATVVQYANFTNIKSIVFETGSSGDTADRLRITSDDGLNSLPFGSGSFSMGVWFKSPSLDPVGYQKVLLARRSNFVAGYDFGLEMTNPAGTLQFSMRDSSGVYKYATSTVDYNDDAWHFATIGWNGTDEIFLDIDGGDERLTTTSTSRSGSAYGEVLTIGAYSSTTDNRGWSGNLDEVSFWNKGLSAAECITLYNSGCPTDLKASSGLVSWWRMGDYSEDSTDSSDSSARIYDVVGGYNATPVETEGSDIVEITPGTCATAGTSNATGRDVISDGGYSYSAPWGHTYEVEIIFPKDMPYGQSYFSNNFQTASIFGCHQAVESDPGFIAAGSDAWALQVEAIRKDIRTNDAYFRLTASAGRLSADIFPLLTTSLFKDVYNNSKWNFAIRITPKDHPWTGSVSGTTGDAKIEFIGYNYELDYLVNSFSISGTLSASNTPDWTTLTTYPQRFYVGAHRTNWTGSVLERSNVKASSFRVWWNSLSDKELMTHAQDTTNFGVSHPYQHSDGYLSNLDASGNPLPFGRNLMAPPSSDTLILNWDFATVTSSNTLGQFTVADVSSGSSALREASRYGNFSTYAEYQHTGLGYGFPASSTGSIDRRYIQTAKRMLPEVINSSCMVNIISENEDKLFTRETRPIQYFFSFEKSMANVISEEIVKLFATIVDFNNLIGDPVNRYRQEYKQMEKFRELYFNRVENTPDLEKFVEFFKWIDSSISTMLQQLVPGSSKFSDTLRNMVESHILERNKYWNKFPTLEMKASDPESGLRGINEMLYSWKRGHAPVPNSLTGSNCEWWFERASRDNTNITSGDSAVDGERNIIRLANDYRSGSGPTLAVSRASTATKTTYKGSAYAIRNFTKPYKLSSKELPTIHGGSNLPKSQKPQYANTELKLNSPDILSLDVSSMAYEEGCNDVINPNTKKRFEGKIKNSTDIEGYASGKTTLLAPFSVFSSSISTGYLDDLKSTKTFDVSNYHTDFYGDDKEAPIQGPFTEKYVGGRSYRHVKLNSSSVDTTLTREEAWNLDFDLVNQKSIDFDGTDDYMSAPSDASLPIGTGDFSVEAWVWGGSSVNPAVNPITNDAIAVLGTNYAFNGWGIMWGALSGAKIRFHCGGSSYGYAEVDTSPREWIHIIGTFDSATEEVKIYKNGGQQTDSVTRSGGLNTSNKLMFGGTDGASYGQMPGKINQVGLWNKVLNSDEAAALYNNGCPADLKNIKVNEEGISGLTHWWRLGQGYGVVSSYRVNNDVKEYPLVATLFNSSILVNPVKSAPCDFEGGFKIYPRTSSQPRSTILREPLAKRPVNIRNIRMTTGSTIIGNYQHDYQIFQTSGRKLNNRFFVKNEGFLPSTSRSTYVSGVIDFSLPRYDLTGANKSIIVERFSAPGGPEVSSRGVLDLNAEEYAVYNEMNQRNSIVRNALNKWSTDHCGRFGLPPFGLTRWQDYNTLANYHKVNRNSKKTVVQKDYGYRVTWTTLSGTYLADYNKTVVSDNGSPWASYVGQYAKSSEILGDIAYFEVEVTTTTSGEAWAVGISNNDNYFRLVSPSGVWPYTLYISGYTCRPIEESGFVGSSFQIAVGDKLRIHKKVKVAAGSLVTYEHLSKGAGSWVVKHTSAVVATASYSPRFATNPSGPGRTITITNARITDDRIYDNWFVQHAIPQSVLQYNWIKDSYDRDKSQPFGYVSNFSVPSGSTSTTASVVQFVTASNWEFTGVPGGARTELVNFVNMIPSCSVFSPGELKYSLFEPKRVLADWYDLRNVELTENGTKLTKTGGGSVWNGAAAARTEVKDGGYLEFEIDQVNKSNFIGLNNNPPAQFEPTAHVYDVFNDINYAIQVNNTADIGIYENGTLKWYSTNSGPASMVLVGYRMRITYEQGNIYYQYDEGTSGRIWKTFYKSNISPDKTLKLYPDIGLHYEDTSFSNIFVGQPEGNFVKPGFGYTMKFVDPNYLANTNATASILGKNAMINSYFNNLNGPYGYPSWKQIRTGETPIARYHKRNNILSVGAPPQLVRLPSPSGSGPGDYFNRRPDISTNFIEPPVSFKYKPLKSWFSLPRLADTDNSYLFGSVRVGGRLEPSDQTPRNAKYIAMKHTYGNNLGKFSQGAVGRPNIAQMLQIPVDKDDPQMYDKFRATNSDVLLQMSYEEIVYPREVNTGLKKTRGRTEYAEVALGNLIDITGSQTTRNTPPNEKSYFSQSLNAILSDGINGIDRGPLYRRTFWRDNEALRNRTYKAVSSSLDWQYWYSYLNAGLSINSLERGPDCYTNTGITSCPTGSWIASGSLPNSQGYQDGCATSVYGLGRTPIAWDFSWFAKNDRQFNAVGPVINYNQYYVENRGYFYSGSVIAQGNVTENDHYGQPSFFPRQFTATGKFPDRGELNSANYQTIAGYAGTAASASTTGFIAYNCTVYPTASAYFYHLPWFNVTALTGAMWGQSGSQASDVIDYGGGDITEENYSYGMGAVYGMRWRTQELSGKRPWFDSYEEYADDIRGLSKKYTIIPEFNMSEHMSYYADTIRPDFLKKNDKFLTLPGAAITSSALTHTQSVGRGFTKEFFNDYSNSDFQKYFGKFEDDYGEYQEQYQEIVLKCRAVKKLLPYQGFYPHQRTLQLASMFSQSLGPYLSGLYWDGGSPTHNNYRYWGALAVQSALQPYFAPGILYNTIKSGIAVDWAAYTGSALTADDALSSGSFLNTNANYRIPFESLLDPLGERGIPQQSFNQFSDTDSQNLQLLYPTYQTGSDYTTLGYGYLGGGVSQNGPTGSSDFSRYWTYENSRKPYAKITDNDRDSAMDDKNYPLYQMAMSNFLAEIPNFFLREDNFGNRLSTFTSKQQKDIKVVEGDTYYMDIELAKGNNLIMWEDYFNTGSAYIDVGKGDIRTIIAKGIDGHSFGPPVQAGQTQYWLSRSYAPIAPAFAPYTPPYYYSPSSARLSFTAPSASFTWDDFFSAVEVQYFNRTLDETFKVLTGSVYGHGGTPGGPAPASASMMTLSSSLNLFGLSVGKDVSYSRDGAVAGVSDSNTTRNDRWVISTKMETPVLDFSNTPREYGYSRGMWGGYGSRPGFERQTNSLVLSLKPPFIGAKSTRPTSYDPNEHNFLNVAFPKKTRRRKAIGEISPQGKDISEAIVAIPYLTERPTETSTAYLTEKQILGRYFFSLRAYPGNAWDACGVHTNIRNSLERSGVAVDQELADKLEGLFSGRFEELGNKPKPIVSTSISEMIEKMDKYVIPPEIDFSRRGNRQSEFAKTCPIEPFAMYIFEFNHTLDKDDLTDIWQGLMPKISTTAELDLSTIRHKRYPIVEFFSGYKIPDNVRWMVFKVKKKANSNYYKMTADTTDDQNFATNPFSIGNEELEHSYNWPYDYFSLVELAELEVGTKFKKK